MYFYKAAQILWKGSRSEGSKGYCAMSLRGARSIYGIFLEQAGTGLNWYTFDWYLQVFLAFVLFKTFSGSVLSCRRIAVGVYLCWYICLRSSLLCLTTSFQGHLAPFHPHLVAFEPPPLLAGRTECHFILTQTILRAEKTMTYYQTSHLASLPTIAITGKFISSTAANVVTAKYDCRLILWPF